MRLDYIFIIPIFNEALILEKSIELLFNFLANHWENTNSNWKIIIADNGSRDNTKEIAKKIIAAHPQKIEYFFVAQPGRGQILKKLVQNIDTNFYMYIDSDIPLELSGIADMLQPLKDGSADIVVGQRFGPRPWERKVLTFGLKIINHLIFHLPIHDSQCGIKAFNKRTKNILSNNCRENGWFLDTEFLVKAKDAGFKVMEIPIQWIEQRYPGRTSKVRILDIYKGLVAMKNIYFK
jgi:glycosyltransferase involved in cell wall biosynthesis